MRGLSLATLDDGRKAVIIRTSDRIAFKHCRRKWGFSSHLKMNLSPKALASPLWFGSAVHYALEDFHGYNVYKRPANAFKAYCLSTAKNFKRELPPDAQEHYRLGLQMMDYYVDYWLASYPRPADQTYWEDGVPQVEVNFEIPIPINPESTPLLWNLMRRCGADCVLYRGTIDRVAIDEYDRLWIVEYKTAKIYQATHYQTDPQVTTYVWAASQIYSKPVAGVIYHQFVKKEPKGPPLLVSGGLSTAQNLVTSYPLYAEALTNLYGSINAAPSKNKDKLNMLMKAETADRDRYIIREKIHRNVQQCSGEAWKILMELEDILNPDLPLYPNPTRDCARMCSFTAPCINMDDGSDWEQLLDELYMPRDTEIDRLWRRRLPDPKDLLAQSESYEVQEEPDLADIQAQELERYTLAEIAAGEGPPPEYVSTADPWEGADSKGRFNMHEVD